MFSTLAYENKKGNQPNHDLDYIARDTWMPSLENWDGGLKIFCVHVRVLDTLTYSLALNV